MTKRDLQKQHGFEYCFYGEPDQLSTLVVDDERKIMALPSPSPSPPPPPPLLLKIRQVSKCPSAMQNGVCCVVTYAYILKG